MLGQVFVQDQSLRFGRGSTDRNCVAHGAAKPSTDPETDHLRDRRQGTSSRPLGVVTLDVWSYGAVCAVDGVDAVSCLLGVLGPCFDAGPTRICETTSVAGRSEGCFAAKVRIERKRQRERRPSDRIDEEQFRRTEFT